MKQIIIAAFLWVYAISVSAYDFKYRELCYNITSDSTVEVTNDSIPYKLSRVIIPPSVVYNEKSYTVSAIGAQAFSFCENIEIVEIPNSVVFVDRWAFMLCRSQLRTLTLPNSVKKIGYNALAMQSLEEIYIGNGIEHIDGNFFSNHSLRSITISAKNPPEYKHHTAYIKGGFCNTIYVPKESLYKYANAEGWKYFGRILPIGSDGSEGVFKPDFDPKNKVNSIAGCKFGCSAEQAVNHFNNKFKYYAERNSYEAYYIDVCFAGYDFDIMQLQFTYNKQTNRYEFCSIEFRMFFDISEYDSANRCLKSIRRMYSEKYSNETEYPEDNMYQYGMIEESYSRTTPPIMLWMEKATGKDGKERYYITLTYYAFNALDRYIDDI